LRYGTAHCIEIHSLAKGGKGEEKGSGLID
jgi:hypothetical protein